MFFEVTVACQVVYTVVEEASCVEDAEKQALTKADSALRSGAFDIEDRSVQDTNDVTEEHS